jgi:hypothetical protein
VISIIVHHRCEEWLQDTVSGSGDIVLNSAFVLCKLHRPVEIDLELNEDDNIPSDGQDLLAMDLVFVAT